MLVTSGSGKQRFDLMIAASLSPNRGWRCRYQGGEKCSATQISSFRPYPAKTLGHAQISEPDRRPEYSLSAPGGGEGRGEVGGLHVANSGATHLTLPAPRIKPAGLRL